jgi:hypothetical protein
MSRHGAFSLRDVFFPERLADDAKGIARKRIPAGER